MPLEHPDQLQELIDTMKEFMAELPSHKRALRRAWKGTVVATGVAIAAIIMSIISYVAILNINSLREEQQIGACLQANELIVGMRNSQINGILTFAEDPKTLSSEELAALNAYTKSVNDSLPLRDCSPEGIKLYYSLTQAKVNEESP